MRIKKGAMDYKYALVWIVINLILLIFTLFPKLVSFFARILGIGLPLNLLFFLGILACLFFTFGLAMSYNKLKLKTYALTQQIAILDKMVLDLTATANNIKRDNEEKL